MRIAWFSAHAVYCETVCLRYIQSTCATSGEGLYEGLDWLSSNIANKVYFWSGTLIFVFLLFFGFWSGRSVWCACMMCARASVHLYSRLFYWREVMLYLLCWPINFLLSTAKLFYLFIFVHVSGLKSPGRWGHSAELGESMLSGACHLPARRSCFCEVQTIIEHFDLWPTLYGILCSVLFLLLRNLLFAK